MCDLGRLLDGKGIVHIVFSAALIVLAAMPAAGADKTWIDGSDWWDYGPNWSPSGQPQNSDNVFLTQSDSTNRTVSYWNKAYPTAVLSQLMVDSTGSGTMQLTIGVNYYLGATTEQVGYSGRGIITQSMGTNAITNLQMGYNSTGNGTYNLSGGSLSVSGMELVGYYGAGTFNHSGGSHVVGNLCLGYMPSSRGTYGLSGGYLTANSETIGDDNNAVGSFTQTAGTHTVLGALSLADFHSNSAGTYKLNGGAMSVGGNLYIGAKGNGTFAQNGGLNTVGGTLLVANVAGGVGTYDLEQGTLNAAVIQVNPNGHLIANSTLSAPVINQSGGVIGGFIYNTGTFNYSGGNSQDMFFFNQGAGVMNLNADLQCANLTNTSSVPMNIPAGRGVYIDDNHINNDGVINLAGTMTSAETINVGYQGSGTVTQTGGYTATQVYQVGALTGSRGTYNLQNGTFAVWSSLSVGGQGVGRMVQTGGVASVDSGTGPEMFIDPSGVYTLTGGSLHSYMLSITGLLGQSGGTQSSGNVYMNGTSGLAGSYSLSGSGLAGIYNLHLGENGYGTFTQTGGTSNISGTFYAGENSGGVGVYSLGGGRLNVATNEIIGSSGAGVFTQTGGTHIVTGALTLAYNSTAAGTFNMQGGSFSAATITLARPAAVFSQSAGTITSGNQHVHLGAFSQTGGANIISGDLTINESSPPSSATYSQSGGSLQAVNEWVGWSAAGTFTHSGGTNRVGTALYVGNSRGGLTSLYTLSSGATLLAASETLGNSACGIFTQTGGLNAVSGTVTLCTDGLSTGIYQLQGGTLSANTISLGYYGGGTLDVSSAAARLEVTGRLKVRGNYGTLTAVPGSVIHMLGSTFENQCTSSSALAGLSNINMVFEGGPARTSTFEVAGQDLGCVAGGWVSNFALGTLSLGGASAGRLRLVDASDNQPGWVGAEALYTDTLALNAGAAVDLNGLHLYYRNGGVPKQFFQGDANLDGKVDVLDLGILATNWQKTGMAWAQADFNGDGKIDVLDLGILATNWQAGSGSFADAAASAGLTVPEPATLALLALGGLAIIRRRTPGFIVALSGSERGATSKP